MNTLETKKVKVSDKLKYTGNYIIFQSPGWQSMPKFNLNGYNVKVESIDDYYIGKARVQFDFPDGHWLEYLGYSWEIDLTDCEFTDPNEPLILPDATKLDYYYKWIRLEYEKEQRQIAKSQQPKPVKQKDLQKLNIKFDKLDKALEQVGRFDYAASGYYDIKVGYLFKATEKIKAYVNNSEPLNINFEKLDKQLSQVGSYDYAADGYYDMKINYLFKAFKEVKRYAKDVLGLDV